MCLDVARRARRRKRTKPKGPQEQDNPRGNRVMSFSQRPGPGEEERMEQGSTEFFFSRPWEGAEGMM